MKNIQRDGVYREIKPVSFTNVSINDRFWTPRLTTNKETTLEACLDQCERTGRLSNFAKAAGFEKGEFQGIFYNDSDVYKVIEGIAYSLMLQPDPRLEERTDKIIDLIAAAQQEDGYLYTFHTLKNPNNRWTDMNLHEAYCAGHLIEAAIAYYKATNKRKLFDTAVKVADHLCEQFGPEKQHWVPGHEEIELALVKLYQETKAERYWKLAFWFLEERGKGYGAGSIWDREDFGPAYVQDDTPVADLEKAVGHSVRAMYLYSGMADIAVLTGHQPYMDALDRVWNNIINRKMYVTGGIGSSKQNEGFTEDYDLPNKDAYCETCAAIGMVYWNHRMNLIHHDAKYANVMERSLYNGALAGVSLTGDKFFYDNPLASDGDHHRVEWFDCSCCPTQICRFIPSIGNYVYASSDDEIWVNLYISGRGTVPLAQGNIEIVQRTEYPWVGEVEIMISSKDVSGFSLNLRQPGWCKGAEIILNGERVEPERQKGYLRLKRKWRPGDRIVFKMEMPVERVYSDPKVESNRGKTALQRGPLVYCLEQTDNDFDIDTFTLSKNASFTVEHNEELLNGVTVINVEDGKTGKEFVFIPYHLWDHRDPGPMKVWIDEAP